jgi:hypothetical protein
VSLYRYLASDEAQGDKNVLYSQDRFIVDISQTSTSKPLIETDPTWTVLDAARGIFVGLLLSGMLWALLFFAIRAITR